MNEKVFHKENLKEPKIIAGFWRRLGAFFIDALILGLLGFLLGWVFFDFFVNLGPWGRLFGFAISLLYFGILNSEIGHGQTIGKFLLDIRVEKVSGGYLKPIQSFGRFFIFGLFYFLNNAEIPQSLSNQIVGILLVLAIFGLGGSIIYLFIFNKKTRQSLHDLIIGSVVVMGSASSKRKIEKIWPGHFVSVGLIFAIALSLPFFLRGLIPQEMSQNLFSVYSKLNHLPEVRTSAVSANTTKTISSRKGTVSATYFAATLILHHPLEDDDNYANQVADLIMKTYPEVIQNERLILQFRFGYDIGIASWSETLKYNYTFPEWVKRIHNAKAGA